MSANNIEDILSLSPMQQGMLYHSLMAPGSGTYIEQSSWTLTGPLDVNAFQRAWQQVLNRHMALRAGFVWEGLDEPVQVIYHEVELPFCYEDWSDVPEPQQAGRLAAYLQADRERGFDLTTAPLMRMALIRLGAQKIFFLWSHHHLLLDGWSQPVLLGDFVMIYQSLREGRAAYLPPAYPYSRYIAWLQQQDPQCAQQAWQNELAGYHGPAALEMAFPGRKTAADEYSVAKRALSEETARALHCFVRENGLTLNTLMQGVWGLMLSRYTRDEDVVFGATVSGRPAALPGADTIVGLLINTLPVRMQVTRETPAVEWLRAIQSHQASLREFDHTSLIDLQGWSEVPRGTPLFESILVFENYPASPMDAGTLGGLKIEPSESFSRTNYPLTFAISPGDPIGLMIAYETARFDAETVERMLGHIQTLLDSLMRQPDLPVGRLQMLTDAEQRQLESWSQESAPVDLAAPIDLDKTVLDLIAEQARVRPSAVALRSAALRATAPQGEVLEMTYGELERRSNQLAHALRERGIGRGSLVGICMPPGLELITGILGIQKAGAAYLPIDPVYPPDRQAFMIEDSQASLVLTCSALAGALPIPAEKAFCLDFATDAAATETAWPAIAPYPATPLGEQVSPDDAAYVIYTSGSTGRPKGTKLLHRGLSNLVQLCRELYQIGPGDCAVEFFAISFDPCVMSIFTTLAHGATLLLAPRETVTDPLAMTRLIQEQGVTHLSTTASFMALLNPDDYTSLKMVLAGGEAFPLDLARRWSSHAGQIVYNAYGPTEATVISTLYEVHATPADAQRVSIGRPVANTRACILDEQLLPAPVGVPGELHLGGVSLAAGYLNRPELSAAKFIDDPAHPGEKLYKTGDLARWLPDGTLDFLGRLDDQVKIRGFRVELGEIETLLNEHPAVHQAAVLAYDDAGSQVKSLVAYVTPAAPGQPPTVNELVEHLKAHLPGYMIPARFMLLEAFPLTNNGKIDRRRLPAPEKSASEAQATFRAPRSMVEQGLADIWRQILHVDAVGLDDDFFALGGHSLRAAQLVSRVREVFQAELPLHDLFSCTTLLAMAARIEALVIESHGQSAPAVTPAAHGENIPLSFAQQRLWFLDQLAPGSLFYNLPMPVRLKGQVDLDVLQKTLDEIVRRHSALRTRFVGSGGQAAQEILPDLRIPIRLTDLTGLNEAEREPAALRLAMEEAQQPFSLSEGPLLRAALLRLAAEDHIAIVTMHHIISDGWSLGVFLRELGALYSAFLNGEPSPLAELPVQYADYAVWQRGWLQGAVLDEQLAYWKSQLAGLPPMLELPTDHPRPAVQTAHGDVYSFDLPKDLSDQLADLSQGEGVTLFMTLLAAFQTLLARYSGQEDIPVGTAVANRGRSEIEGLIGFFVNTLVLRARLPETATFRDLLAQVRETCLGAYAHQDLPFEALVEALRPERNLSHTPLFQVMFTMDPPLEGVMQLPGLAIAPIQQHTGTATFDLTLSFAAGADGLQGTVEFNTDLWERGTIRRMMANFQTLLSAIAGDPEQPLWSLPVISAGETRELLVEWNRTSAPDAPLDRCAHELFEARALQQPEATALMFCGPDGDKSLTYRELNERANRLAHYLQKHGVGTETIVAISTDRSLESIIGILGVLKAGGAYLPLDPSWPTDRLAFMLEDSQTQVLLTQSFLVERLPLFQGDWPGLRICLDSGWPEIAQESSENLPRQSSPDKLAYMIYTSGSTGKPKGALLQHRGLCNLAEAQRKAFDVTPESHELQFSPFSFDASVWETVMALGNGAALVLAPQEVLASAPDLLRLMQRANVTHVTLPPSVLQVLPQAELPNLRVVVAAGEACPAELVARWSPNRRFFNAYGPTETTVCAAMYLCQPEEGGPPPIGKPLPNMRLYVCDRQQQLTPVGVPGELLVGGVNLARGYHHRPEMTAEKFISNPFAGPADGPHYTRLYRTGDLVRWRADGNLEFLGRIDQQVKIRGFRVELGEIEEALLQHPQILHAAVVARSIRRENRLNDHLVAYIVPHELPGPAAADLREFLRKSLPEYMVPSAFVALETMPISPSGKIDRRALAAREVAVAGEAREYVAPRTENESKLAEMCATLLNVEKVGVTDNFFDLGGHSLLATQFISHIRDAFQVEIPLRSLFEHPTVAELALEIEQRKASAPAADSGPIQRVSRDQYRRKRPDLPASEPGAEPKHDESR